MAVNEKSKANLRPANTRTPEERSALGRKGAEKTARVRRKKKEMRETLQELMKLTVHGGPADKLQNLAEVKGKNITAEQAILLAQIQRAMRGDTQAAVFVRDTSGNKPKDVQEVQGALPVVISGQDDLQD